MGNPPPDTASSSEGPASGSTAEAAAVTDDQVTVVVTSLHGEVLATLHMQGADEVSYLKEKLAVSQGIPAGSQRLVVGSFVLEDAATLQDAQRLMPEEEREPDGVLKVLLVRLTLRTLEVTSKAELTFQARDPRGGRVFRSRPECPRNGDYGYDSGHYWANHSTGGTYLRLPLPEGRVQINEVVATMKAQDQGWGGTGEAGAVLVLLDQEGHELAYSVQSLRDHGGQELCWHVTPASSGGSFPAKAAEAAFSSICVEGENMVLELRIFTPDYAGWSVTATKGTISATIYG